MKLLNRLRELRDEHYPAELNEAGYALETYADLDDEHLLGYTIDGSAVGDSWEKIIVLLNGGDDASTFNVDASKYQIMVNGESAGLNPQDSFEGETIEVPGKTLMVLVSGEGDVTGDISSSDNYILFIIVMVIGAGLLGYGFSLRKKNLSA